MGKGHKIILESGQRFGKNTVIKEMGQNKHRCYLWLVRCDCGNTRPITATVLINGESQSCGKCNFKIINGKIVKRKCIDCGLWKSINDFYPKKIGSDSFCKDCNKRRTKGWRNKNKQRISLKDREYRINNKNRIYKKHNEWVDKNRDRRNAYSRKSWAKYRERYNKDRLQKIKENPEHYRKINHRSQLKTAYELTDGYIAKLLQGGPARPDKPFRCGEVIPPEVIEIKRKEIMVHRAFKQLKEAINE